MALLMLSLRHQTETELQCPLFKKRNLSQSGISWSAPVRSPTWQTPSSPEGKGPCNDQSDFCRYNSCLPIKVFGLVGFLGAPFYLLHWMLPTQTDLCANKLSECLICLSVTCNRSGAGRRPLPQTPTLQQSWGRGETRNRTTKEGTGSPLDELLPGHVCRSLSDLRIFVLRFAHFQKPAELDRVNSGTKPGLASFWVWRKLCEASGE